MYSMTSYGYTYFSYYIRSLGYFHRIVSFIKTAYNTNKRWQVANVKIEHALRSRSY